MLDMRVLGNHSVCLGADHGMYGVACGTGAAVACIQDAFVPLKRSPWT
jgi:hypothetical protein